MLSENFGSHTGHRSIQFAKSLRTFAKPPANHGLPSALDHPQGGIDGTPIAFAVAVGMLIHGCVLMMSNQVLESAQL
jgi:hypothetical protein